MKQIACCKKLQKLSIYKHHHADLTPRGIEQLESLSQLRELEFYHVESELEEQIEGARLLKRMQGLLSLNLYGNAFSEEELNGSLAGEDRFKQLAGEVFAPNMGLDEPLGLADLIRVGLDDQQQGYDLDELASWGA